MDDSLPLDSYLTDSVQIAGDIDAFFLAYESGALAIAYDEAMLKQQKAFRLNYNLQDTIADVADVADVIVDASED